MAVERVWWFCLCHGESLNVRAYAGVYTRLFTRIRFAVRVCVKTFPGLTKKRAVLVVYIPN